MNAVACAYPISPIDSGVSGAWKVAGDDRKHYLAKLAKDGDHAAPGETFRGCLAGLFGLPSMDPVLVAVGPGPIGRINRVREERGLGPAESGPHFGVRNTASFLAVKFLDEAGVELTADRIANLDAVPDIQAFDAPAQNDDRHCGNTAVDIDASGAGCSYFIFESAHSFGGPARKANTIRVAHPGPSPASTFRLIAAGMRSFCKFDQFLRTFELSLARWIGDFIAELPPEMGRAAAADARALKGALAAPKRGSLEAAVPEAPALLG